MSGNGSAPGWLACCPKCSYQVDVESLGWIRVNAYSWGKRNVVYCPQCQRKRWMRIVHFGADGRPDQPFKLVLAKVLELQIKIWRMLIG